MNSPTFSIYHANAKGTGSAIKMTVVPACGDYEGVIKVRIANQVGFGAIATRFDWDNACETNLHFEDICKMLQVFRGECESIDERKGVYHRHAEYAQIVRMEHRLEPTPSYNFEIVHHANGGEPKTYHIFFNSWEALGISEAFWGVLSQICFGIPRPLVALTPTVS